MRPPEVEQRWRCQRRRSCFSAFRFMCQMMRIRLVAKLIEHRANFRALIGECARKNATPSESKNVCCAQGAAHIIAHCLCRFFLRALANQRTNFGTMFK